ncbi:molybdate ABC transporter substrate-binding protein [Pseudogracilibacillus sp. SO30301A]|uniref:molybdate ABC transporter substrate-binding protein n=1 Tax=Pseudogracilibacillus sp. SO30301A TaxID=3098291 RepID=UPI00300E6094
MKSAKLFFTLIFVVFLLVSCSTGGNKESTSTNKTEESATNEDKSELFISAAASLTDAMDEVKETFEKEYNVELTFNFAGSGKLAQQIQQGAAIDVFISANENWMDTLMEEGLVKEDTRKNITGNKLVLIVGEDSPISYDSFEELDRNDVDEIAIGNPESVPAGEYTKEILENLGKWGELEDNLVYAQDVRQVLTYVETGNADIGFVYESDAKISDAVKVIAESDPDMHDPIIYPGAIIADSKNEVVAEQFIQFLLSEEGQEILEKYGFTK